MVLFHQIIQLLDLTDLDGGTRLLLECIKRCGVGAALVDGHLLRQAVLSDGLLEEAPGGLLVAVGGEQEVDGLSLLVDRAIEVFPLTFNLIRSHPSASSCRRGVSSRSGKPLPAAG